MGGSRNAGRRDHGWCVGNEIARRIADLGLRKSGERGKQRRLILVKTDKSCMRHRKVGVDIDPRRRPDSGWSIRSRNGRLAVVSPVSPLNRSSDA
jgi:hypothetical protein